ncbi:MAG: hypothetical protein PVH47_00525 [Thiohalocapsa sp.]|jgi:hypothetical protein
MSTTKTKTLAAALTTAALLTLQGPAVAADCKGLEKNRCESNNSCTWVDGYQRKDGVKVSGHCRSKGGKSSSRKSED